MPTKAELEDQMRELQATITKIKQQADESDEALVLAVKEQDETDAFITKLQKALIDSEKALIDSEKELAESKLKQQAVDELQEERDDLMNTLKRLSAKGKLPEGTEK